MVIDFTLQKHGNGGKDKVVGLCIVTFASAEYNEKNDAW